jgi:LAO/AO transport system kinase
MEVADIFVINKAEREGADRLQQQVEAMLDLAPSSDGWKPPVMHTTATEGTGCRNSWRQSSNFAMAVNPRDRRSRDVEHWKERLRALLSEHLLERAVSASGGKRVSRNWPQMWPNGA